MARRRKILGLPIGKKKPVIGGKALLAAGAGLAALPGAVMAGRKVGALVSSGADTADKVSDVTQKAGQLKDAIGGHGSTIGKIGAAVSEIGKLGGGEKSSTPKLSHLIEEHAEVAVPRSVAYNQWTQFEMFPSIVKGAESVEQAERDRTSWRSKIGPSKREWTAEITEQVPDERIAWKSTGGLQMKGVVTFHSLDEDLTRVLVQMEYTPHGPFEQVANVLRVQRRRIRRDLRLFKHFLELRGDATGAWRQRIAKKEGAKEGAKKEGTKKEGAGAQDSSKSSARNGSSRNGSSSSGSARTGSARTGSSRSTTRTRSTSSKRNSSQNGSHRRASRPRSEGHGRRAAGNKAGS